MCAFSFSSKTDQPDLYQRAWCFQSAKAGHLGHVEAEAQSEPLSGTAGNAPGNGIAGKRPVHFWIRPCFLLLRAVVGHSHLGTSSPWLGLPCYQSKRKRSPYCTCSNGSGLGEGQWHVLTSRKRKAPFFSSVQHTRSHFAFLAPSHPSPREDWFTHFCFCWGCESGVRATVLALSSLFI